MSPQQQVERPPLDFHPAPPVQRAAGEEDCSAEAAIRLLAVNGNGPVEGDVRVLLEALTHLPPRFELHVFTKPRGETFRRLQALPRARVVTAEMGGAEAAPPEGGGKVRQVLDFGRALGQLTAYIRRHRIQVLYSIDRGVGPQLAALASRLTGVPFVLSAAYPFYPQNGLTARWVLRQARSIHGHSRYLLDHLEKHLGDPAKFRIVQYGIRVEDYDPHLPVRETREYFGVPEGVRIVAMMGRLDPYKGQDDLIRAAALLRSRRNDVRFLIAGRGWHGMQEHLEGLIRELHLEEDVRLVGYVPSIPHFVAASDVVVMPSWEEPFGLVALEGMAMARPIIATRAGGVPEFVREGEVGLLVPPRQPAELADALMRLLDDPAEARRMGENGRRAVVEKHRVEAYASQVAGLLCSTALGQRV